jgi:two-component system CheB/CheR fusion protein
VRLEQVVTNLLSNAARYTDRGGRIDLSLERRSNEAVVRIKDNGIGIAADVLPHVFELFVQADRSRARERGGLGIGLSIVKQLVIMHGGRVEAHSAGRSQGSEFAVILPLLPAQRFREVEEAKRARVSPADGAPSRRVLVVDDNVDAAASLSKLLKLQGHEIRVDHSGPAALESAAEFNPHVVLLDIGLPGMDGYEVAAEMRKRPETREALLVALSGYGQDEDRERSKAAGFDEHFVKPVNLKDLQTLLANHRPA